MNLLEEVRRHLPSYLSAESEKVLFEELKSFPANVDGRMYSANKELENIILQGDCISELPLFLYPGPEGSKVRGMVISNTCDLDRTNKREFGALRMCYCPLYSLPKYRRFLEGKVKQAKIEGHLEALQQQKISNIFYIPKGAKLEEDYFIRFDEIISWNPTEEFFLKLVGNKQASLSNYGFYLFVFKMSVHFTRLREGVDRG